MRCTVHVELVVLVMGMVLVVLLLCVFFRFFGLCRIFCCLLPPSDRKVKHTARGNGSGNGIVGSRTISVPNRKTRRDKREGRKEESYIWMKMELEMDMVESNGGVVLVLGVSFSFVVFQVPPLPSPPPLSAPSAHCAPYSVAVRPAAPAARPGPWALALSR